MSSAACSDAEAPAGAPTSAPPDRERRATWLELFFDLVFAAAVADVGGALGADYSPSGLGRFAFLFILIWRAWVDHTFLATRFDPDGPAHRLLTLGQVGAIAVMAINAETDLGSREAAGFAASYAVTRLLLMLQYLQLTGTPASRRLAATHAIGAGMGAVLWLGAALVPPPARFVGWALALLIDTLTPVIATRAGGPHPPDPAHLPERFGLFSLILLGEAVVATMAGMRHQETWSAPAASAAALGLGLTFAFWWGYYERAGAAKPRSLATEADRRRLWTWSAAHLPFCFGIAVASVGIERVVAGGGMAPLGSGAALLSGGIALALAGLGAVAANSDACGSTGSVKRHAVGSLVVLFGAAWGDQAPVWLLAALTAVALGVVVARPERAARITAPRTGSPSPARSWPAP